MLCPRREEMGVDSTIHNVSKEDTWLKDRRCSFCGSMDPFDFMNTAIAGVEITPTDKSYKVYVQGGRKFYFQHLTTEQKKEFVQLYNDHKVKLAYPGYFYVRPFFMAQVAPPSVA